MSKFFTRMGDGFSVEMDEKELMQEIEDGVLDAAERAKIEPLSDDEKKRLLEYANPIAAFQASKKAMKSL